MSNSTDMGSSVQVLLAGRGAGNKKYHENLEINMLRKPSKAQAILI